MEKIIDNKNGTYSFVRDGKVLHTGKWGDKYVAPKSVASTPLQSAVKPALNLFDFTTLQTPTTAPVGKVAPSPTPFKPVINTAIKNPMLSTQSPASAFIKPEVKPTQSPSSGLIPQVSAGEMSDEEILNSPLSKDEKELMNRFKSIGLTKQDFVETLRKTRNKTQEETTTQPDNLSAWQKYVEPLGAGFTEPLAQATKFNERYLNPQSLLNPSDVNIKRAEEAAQGVRKLTQEPGADKLPGYDIGKFAGEIALLETMPLGKLNEGIKTLGTKYAPEVVKNILKKAVEKSPKMSKYVSQLAQGIIPSSQYQTISKGNLDPVDILVNASIVPGLTSVKDAIAGGSKVLKNVIGYGISKLSRLSPETISFIRNNPELIAKGKTGEISIENLKAQVDKLKQDPTTYEKIINDINTNIGAVKSAISEQANTRKFNLVSKIDEKIKTTSEELKGIGQEYQGIRENAVNTNKKEIVDTAKNGLGEFGISFNAKGETSFKGSNLSITKDQPIIKQAFAEINQVLTGNKKPTSNDILNIRQRLSALLQDKELTKGGERAVLKIRQSIDDLAKSKSPELASIDASYSSKIKELSDLKNQFIGPDGKLKENLPSIIDNLLSPNNKLKLDKMKKVYPEIETELKNIKNGLSTGEGLKSLSLTSKSTDVANVEKIIPGVGKQIEKANAIKTEIENLNRLHNADPYKGGNLSTGILKKPELLAELEKRIPGATTTLKVQKAIEDMAKPGSQVGNLALGGAVTSALLGQFSPLLPATIIGLMSNPKLVGNIVQKIGYKDKVVNGILEKIRNNVRLDTNDAKVISAINNAITPLKQ